jgi:hypothetical protein
VNVPTSAVSAGMWGRASRSNGRQRNSVANDPLADARESSRQFLFSEQAEQEAPHSTHWHQDVNQ